jgi:hypothetical protein
VSEYKFLIESPSVTDDFDSKSHDRTARSVFETLQVDNDVNLVGVEGELGSGKSTVIKLVQKLTDNTEYELIEFDVERFQHGAIKKALIETIYEAIKGKIIGDASEAKIVAARNVALGNHLEYTSEVKSNINIWIVWFGISLLFAFRVFVDALVGIGNFILYIVQAIQTRSIPNAEIDYFAIVSLLIVLLPWHIVRCAQKRKKVLGFLGKPPSTGDIFKRNSTDKVSETIEINKEVGVFELQQALRVFISELPENIKFILVIDNLDRVTREKLREVWSDIEVFTSIAHNKIQIILPYSRNHIAIALMDKKGEGREFISKRIPINFRVSPIITADWMNWGEKLIINALGEVPREDLQLIVRLINSWSEYDKKQVTPRYLKKLVNSVVSIMKIDREEVSLISAFFFQLASQINDIPITSILNKSIEEDENDEEKPFQAQLGISWTIIEKKLSFEKWSKDIASIYYQANYEIAESELLKNPLEIALENGNGMPFVEKQYIYAYSKILTEILTETGTENFIRIILYIQNLDSDESSAWIKEWLPKINQYISLDSRPIATFDNWIEAHEGLNQLNVDISIEHVKKEFEKKDNEGLIEDVGQLVNLYRMSAIIGELPSVLTDFDAGRFIGLLWPNRKLFPDWEIEKINLDEDNVADILAGFVSTKSISQSLLGRISESYRAGWTFQDASLDALVPVVIDMEELEADPDNVEKNMFSAIWYSKDQFSHYSTQISSIKDEDAKQRLQAQAIANMVYHRSFQHLASIEPQIVQNSKFDHYLSNYLAVSCDFTKMREALKQPAFSDILKNALKLLIEGRRIKSQNIAETIKDFDSLQTLGLDKIALIKWLESWIKHLNLDLAFIQNLNRSFLEAVFENNDKNVFREKIIDFIGFEDANEEWWITQFESPNSNIKFIFDVWFGEKNNKFVSSSLLTKALKTFFASDNESKLKDFDNPDWIKTVLGALASTSANSVIRVLNVELNKMNGSIEAQFSIIRNFGDRVTLSRISNIDEQKHALTLFENALVDEPTSEWFDMQDYSFENWDKELIEQFAEKMHSYKQSLPELNFNKLMNEDYLIEALTRNTEIDDGNSGN